MEKDFSNLINEIRKCNICEDKFGFKPHPVVIGSATSKIVQISQAPSKMVDTTLKPFTDQSGKKLKYEWYQITDEEFYNPDNFFITALAHCYPGKDKNGNDKAPPKICYEKWIKKELEYIDNKLYIIYLIVLFENIINNIYFIINIIIIEIYKKIIFNIN